MADKNTLEQNLVTLEVRISKKAADLIATYAKTTGYNVKDRVVEELAFAIHELLKIDKERNISLEEFRGVLKTFRRFEGNDQ
ncbi:MAG: hypothetical protein OEY22_05835 [Candidatus Bathyarchaeota archaeon]|nr:hypothetical protein [Candidatus Bathyarchaeota archaeon]MDH5787006.1 hypothetical protein [Candidatus Bathyarchaeota archaeon]